MKNKKKLAYATLAGVAALSVTSCGKYEDGPKFSLRTKKTRVAGEWSFKSLNDQALSGYSVSMKFDRDGKFSQTVAYSGYSYTYNGTWDFSSDKENLVITSNGNSDSYDIRRLTNKELWLDDDATEAVGDIWKLEAK